MIKKSLIAATCCFSLVGCQAVQNNPNTAIGAGVGALVGALAGTLVGASVIGGTDTLAANIWSPVIAQIIVFSMAIVVIRLFPRGIVGGRPRR